METVGLAEEATVEPDEPPNAPTPSTRGFAGLACSDNCATFVSISDTYCTSSQQRATLRFMTFLDFVMPVEFFMDPYVTVPFLAVLPPQRESAACGASHSVAGSTARDVVNSAEAAGFSFGVPPERFITWHEMWKTLVLCGVKRHHCQDALRKLWVYLLLLCYGGAAGRNPCERWRTSQLPGTSTGYNGDVVGDFAVLVRYDALDDFLRSIRCRGVIDRSKTVHFAEFAAAVASPPGTQAPAPPARYTLVVTRHTFDRCIAGVLSRELRGQRLTVTPLPRWSVAQAIVQNRRPLVVFCGGTSGCGKSTLSSLITTHLCLHTLLSTDTIRQSLRRTLRPEKYPELLVSTYEAHRAKGGGGTPIGTGARSEEKEVDPQLLIAAYEKQCEVVLQALDGLLEKFIGRSQAVVVEGVHLLATYMQRKSVELRARGVLCVPFIVCIAKEQQHVERFCTRAKCMALSPDRNKYVSQFRHIRLIQQHLLEQAYALNMRVINNTNLDRSLMEVHTYLLDSIDHGMTTAVWDGHRSVAVDRSDATKSATASSADTHARAPLEEAVVAEKPRGSGNDDPQPHYHHPFADPNINGKRMLALLLRWRSEKTKRRATDAAAAAATGDGAGGGGIHLATSLLAFAKRARSAESLTPFRLQVLCSYSCLGDASDGFPAQGRRNETTGFDVCGSKRAVFAGADAGAERFRCHGSSPMSLRPAFSQPHCGFFRKRPEEIHHAVPRRGHPLRRLPAAAFSTPAPVGRGGKVFRSASADAAAEAVEDNRAQPQSGNLGRSPPGMSMPGCKLRAATRHNKKSGADTRAVKEKEEEQEDGGWCELPSLMGS
ncbi:hypothetical protein TraAM80_02218 [Trypanosoma rangeli]|uniref:Uncharacterized protein n=1 Tax=Trypanosoma rangeli TaxID=5698 RepID=A0A3S5IRY8_TRYRA|nr:uncharacterized protein TraAM80_02218 [Trypanosoma rangeli]RNF09344.1 hypothetical protein TraAM80_02218 [Trypanosoma rangeli]|eukprot:RNF09344.1 hypothetical protein TraAM80_02218 [Trypanosoma rangeli]